MPSRPPPAPHRVLEFFAGIGLMRAGLESTSRFSVAWANDADASKQRLYTTRFPGDPPGHFRLADVRDVRADDLPTAGLATASFPCTDLSLAGDRRGLAGGQSGVFWEFHRLLAEVAAQGRQPAAVLLENVVGFATSRGGADLEDAVAALNGLGYVCDLLVLDAAWFLPQSRPRMFVVGALAPGDEDAGWEPSPLRPRWIAEFLRDRPHLKVQARPLTAPSGSGGSPGESPGGSLSDVVERLPAASPAWWPARGVAAFADSLSPVQARRVADLRAGRGLGWRTAYRRTRGGRAVWEVRRDEVAGCLRTARGGSSRQAVVEAGRGRLRVRWMTPLEYARLQGAPDYPIEGFRPNEVYFGFGDAVCVPAVAWLAERYLAPVLDEA